MSDTKDGGPAFPVTELNQSTGFIHAQHFGMSLRDHFAGLAMQAIQSAGGRYSLDMVAADAYQIADAMLKERSNG